MNRYFALSWLILFASLAQASIFIQENCKDEWTKLCRGDEKSKPFLCLKKHPEVWSKKCQQAFELYNQEQSRFHGPCATIPGGNPCLDLEPGEGQVGPCYEAHLKSFPKACADYYAQPVAIKYSDVRLDVQQICHADVQAYCAGVERGKGRVYQCLAKNREKLSKECKENL